MKLPGNTSTSEDISVALNFAFPLDFQQKEDHVPTLFVISVKNGIRYMGVRMNNECYSAYPSENELVLKEGCPVQILYIMEVTVQNKDPAFKFYNGHRMAVIGLYHK